VAVETYKNETELVAWKTVVDTLESMRSAWRFQENARQRALETFQRDLVSAKAHEIGWTFDDFDSAIIQRLKALLFSAAASSNDQKAVDEAHRMFLAFKRGNAAAAHANLQLAVFKTVLSTPSSDQRSDFQFIWQTYLETKDADLKRTALTALGATRHPRLIEFTLDRVLSKDVPMAEMHLPLTTLVGSNVGVVAAWHWMERGWEQIFEKVRAGGGLGYEMGRIVQLCVSGTSELDVVERMQRFFEDKDTGSFSSGLAQGLDEAKVKAKWVQSAREDADRWLREAGYLVG